MEDTTLHFLLNTVGLQCYLYPETPLSVTLPLTISCIPLSFGLKSEKVCMVCKSKMWRICMRLCIKIAVSAKESLFIQPSRFKRKHLRDSKVTTRSRRILLPMDFCLKFRLKKVRKIPLAENCEYKQFKNVKGIYGLHTYCLVFYGLVMALGHLFFPSVKGWYFTLCIQH